MLHYFNKGGGELELWEAEQLYSCVLSTEKAKTKQIYFRSLTLISGCFSLGSKLRLSFISLAPLSESYPLALA